MTTKTVWRISSFSGSNGSCVEIGYRISSFSTTGGSCVAIAPVDDAVLVRNSNHPDRATLAFPAGAMAAFVAACAGGECDDLA